MIYLEPELGPEQSTRSPARQADLTIPKDNGKHRLTELDYTRVPGVIQPGRGSSPVAVRAKRSLTNCCGQRSAGDRTTRERHVLLPPEARAASTAREFVRCTCALWELAEVLDSALLVVSELVTNAVMNARSHASVGLRLTPDHLRVEVRDGDNRPPVLQHTGSEATGGRGLMLVDALACTWGSQPCPVGKIVWAELGLGD